ncbi:hypothetical protein W02_31780 [Nitrospira sp. KM1]|nr:hypothetical protein W02_31780 [Nitrospira sp. KM1]
MVLPGIQALFGFQLVAVFNATFWTALNSDEQLVHYIAISLVTLSVVFVMAPAAYHRQATPSAVSKDFLLISTRLLTWSMFPLMGGILLDFYLVGKLLVQSASISFMLTAMLFAVFTLFWIVLPRSSVFQRWMAWSGRSN